MKGTVRKILHLVFAAAVLLVLCSCGAKEENTTADIFDAEVIHRVDITISAEDWDDLLTHPVDKTKYKVDVSIDGETVKEVSFATKGTSSLLLSASDPDNSRYSYKIDFGHYVKGQNWHGLRKLNLQSSFADATYM